MIATLRLCHAAREPGEGGVHILQVHTLPERPADVTQRFEFLRAVAAVFKVLGHGQPFGPRQLIVHIRVERAQDVRTHFGHDDALNCSRRCSRARARRDLTVPTATPSDVAISS
jgi:hypothetical protein